MCDPKSGATSPAFRILSAFNISSSVALYDYLKSHKNQSKIKLRRGAGKRIPSKINAQSRKFPPSSHRFRVLPRQGKAAERKAKGNAKAKTATKQRQRQDLMMQHDLRIKKERNRIESNGRAVAGAAGGRHYGLTDIGTAGQALIKCSAHTHSTYILRVVLCVVSYVYIVCSNILVAHKMLKDLPYAICVRQWEQDERQLGWLGKRKLYMQVTCAHTTYICWNLYASLPPASTGVNKPRTPI